MIWSCASTSSNSSLRMDEATKRSPTAQRPCRISRILAGSNPSWPEPLELAHQRRRSPHPKEETSALFRGKPQGRVKHSTSIGNVQTKKLEGPHPPSSKGAVI